MALTVSMLLAACGGTGGKIANFDTTSVYDGTGANANRVASLTTYTHVTVECKVQDSYRIDYDSTADGGSGGSGYIFRTTDILTDSGAELNPADVPDC